MYELIQVSPNDYYMDCPAKVGICRISETEAVFIDAGSDKDAAKKALRLTEGLGLTLKAVYVTHAHADHIGGCGFLQEKTGCAVYAYGRELPFTSFPFLEGMGLWGGLPLPELENKFFLAKQSQVTPLAPGVLPKGWDILPLPGHSPDMVGFLTADGTAYVGDAVSSAETLEKYGIGYLFDPEKYLSSLSYLRSVPAARFVPAHAGTTEDIGALVELNRNAVCDVADALTEYCEMPLTFEELLTLTFHRYGLTLNAGQYALIGSTVRSYLTALYRQGKIAPVYADGRMLWQSGGC
ncbi:MAG: MBL fold metallo-hydrolase [Clostridia bacterium]|nr:MBL fold metallo-hydrolase [Clostridia bacterium]